MDQNDLVQAVEQEQPQEVSVENTEELENAQAGEVSEETSPAERPEYISEEYWENGKANLEKMAKDLLTSKERAEGLRKKLSKGEAEKPEDYDNVFEDRDLNDSQKEEAKRYAELAKKHGLTKKQAEGLLSEIHETSVVPKAEQTKAEIIEELGENASSILKGLESYALQQVNSGNWTEADKNAYADMVFDAKSAKLMTKLLNNQKQGVDLSGMGQQSQGINLDEYYAGKQKAYAMISQGDRPGGEALINELDLKYKSSFS